MKKKTVVLISVITAVLLIAGAGIFWYFDSGVRRADLEQKVAFDQIVEPHFKRYTNLHLGKYWDYDVVEVDQPHYGLEVGEYTIAGVTFTRSTERSWIYVIYDDKVVSLETAYQMGLLKKRHLKQISKKYYQHREPVGVRLEGYDIDA
ncbi:MAG: hypothetical protein IJF71_07975 [Clostridia bacterium]|nr:hypothetical protein [Clostridia bacterium]